MTRIDSHAATLSAVRAASNVAASPSERAGLSHLIRLFLTRGVLAVVWAVAFATVSDSLTTGAGVLLVAYPVIDVVASLVDARGGRGPTARKLLHRGAGVSALAALGLAIAATGSVADVLHVFGAWAFLSGLAQIVVALRRRAQLGIQWPMLIAGGLSTLAGIFYNVAAAGDDPELGPLVAYAAAGGTFFVLQAAILAWRHRRATVSGAAAADHR